MRCPTWCSISSIASRQLQSSFGANMVALDNGRPLVMTLKDLLTLFIAFREEVIYRRTKHLLGKAADPRPMYWSVSPSRLPISMR